MTDNKLKLDFKKFGQALTALEAAAAKPADADRFFVDSTIKRFECAIELFWKLLKDILEQEGVMTQFPKEVLRKAYKGGWINEEKLWIGMLDDRNLSCHTYDEQLADKVYGHIQDYIPALRKTYEQLLNKKLL